MSKDALLREMEAGFDSLLATVDGLSEEQMGCVWYGDWCVRDILAHVLTLWFFTTPILYQLEGLPGALRQLIALNPLTPVFNAYQESLFFGRLPDWRPLAVSALIGGAVLVAGYAIFEHYRDVMPEEV